MITHSASLIVHNASLMRHNAIPVQPAWKKYQLLKIKLWTNVNLYSKNVKIKISILYNKIGHVA